MCTRGKLVSCTARETIRNIVFMPGALPTAVALPSKGRCHLRACTVVKQRQSRLISIEVFKELSTSFGNEMGC